MMNWKASLSVAVSAFAGGCLGFAQAHLSSGLPTTTQGIEAIVAGALLAGLVAVVHLYQPVPTPTDPVTRAANDLGGQP